MAIKIPTSSIATPTKIYPNWDFWFENVPSGNTAWQARQMGAYLRVKKSLR
jgi:hypothetical protein